MRSTSKFYNDLSDRYHLIFDNWEKQIKEQAKTIKDILPKLDESHNILDCSCGIGTQIIGLKELGFNISGSDISKQEIERCLVETKKRNLNIQVRVDDMLTLNKANSFHYDVIFSLGNSLPHFSEDKLIFQSLNSMRDKLKDNGMILIGIKDYEFHIAQKTSITNPEFINDQYGKRIIHQVWNWYDDRMHDVHLYITSKNGDFWDLYHSVVRYRAIMPNEVKNLMIEANFRNVHILNPYDSGFYQTIIVGYK